jgi:hypothetical protein
MVILKKFKKAPFDIDELNKTLNAKLTYIRVLNDGEEFEFEFETEPPTADLDKIKTAIEITHNIEVKEVKAIA